MARPDPFIGKVIDNRYRLVECIGVGGFGAVYLAEHLRLEAPFAIKFLSPHLARDEEFAQRFEREAKTTCRLKHPHIVDVVDFGEEPVMGLYLVMEFLKGETLKDRVTHGGPQDAGSVIHIGQQVCTAFEFAHGQGVIHRDLKPANVFLLRTESQTDFVKILDFGIAGLQGDQGKGLTRPGTVLGSPSYMSPEQAWARRIDQRTDIYSLGIIFYEMATGALPFRADSDIALLDMHRKQAPVPPRRFRPELGVPPMLEAIVMRCLAKTPEERYPSMAAVRDALTELGEALRSGDSAVCATVGIGEPETAELPRQTMHEVFPELAPELPTGVIQAAEEARFTPAADTLPRVSADDEHGQTIRVARAGLGATSTAASAPARATPPPSDAPDPLAATGLRETLPPSVAVPRVASFAEPPPPTVPDDAPRRHPRRRVAAVGLAGLVAGALLAVLLSASGQEPAPTASTAPQVDARPVSTTAAVPSAPDALEEATTTAPPDVGRPVPDVAVAVAPAPVDVPQPSPAPAAARLVVRSTPGGAAVLDGRNALCTTPCDLPVPAEGRPLRLTVRLRGYRDSALVLEPLPGETLERDVRLARHVAPAAPRETTPEPPAPPPPRQLPGLRLDGPSPSGPAKTLPKIRLDEEGTKP